MCFHILGVDILIDSQFKPYLLEINASPSFGTDSPLDYKIKKNVVSDSLNLLNFNHRRKLEYIKQE